MMKPPSRNGAARSGQPGDATANECGPGQTQDTTTGPRALWAHTFRGQRGYIGLFAGKRVDGQKLLNGTQQAYFAYPDAAISAQSWLSERSRKGLEVYACAHLLTDRRRIKDNAAEILTLWTDGDGATVPDHLPVPTLIVESSPGRYNYYWRLCRPIPPKEAESLNQRLAAAIGADAGGYDLSQLLRVPNMTNYKYSGQPITLLVSMTDGAYEPDELAGCLPPLKARRFDPSASESTACDDGDEPPIRLDDPEMKWWRGEEVVRNESGNIDRSRTLFRIGLILARKGASRQTIIDALNNRDLTPEFRAYTNRPKEYARIADKVIADARDTATFHFGPDSNEVASLRSEIVQLRADVARLRAERSEIMAVLRNPNLRGGEIRTALAATFEIGSAISAGKDVDGEVTLSRARLAEASGLSEQAVSSNLKRLASFGVLQRRVRRAPAATRVNQSTGEIRDGYVSELRVKLKETPAATLHALAALDPERETKWGGQRVRCAAHPDAAVIVRHTISCSVCGEILEEREERRAPADDDLKSQDDISDEEPRLLWNTSIASQDDISQKNDEAALRSSIMQLQPPLAHSPDDLAARRRAAERWTSMGTT